MSERQIDKAQPLTERITRARGTRYLILMGLIPAWSIVATAGATAAAQSPEPVRPSPTATRTAIPSGAIRDVESRITAIGSELTEVDRESTDALRISRENATAIAQLRPTINTLINNDLKEAKTPSVIDVLAGSIRGGISTLFEKPISTIAIVLAGGAIGGSLAYWRGHLSREWGIGRRTGDHHGGH